MNLAESVERKFLELFHEPPLLVRSPGRVNLIGEHTDYNHGFVLPAAIDRAIYFAVSPRTDDLCRVFAADVNDGHEFSIRTLRPSQKGWPNYLMGVVDQFVRGGRAIGGFQCVFGGNIPIGAGLSSSAALEAGLAFAVNKIFDAGLDNLELVRLAQKAENEFVGVRCGIMDQYINIFGETDRALRIDCRSLEYEYHPFGGDAAIVLFNTGISHSLALSEYNKRREECTAGVEILKPSYPGITHLRDVTPDMLAEHRDRLPDTVYRRCKYVVEENIRVEKACDALERNALGEFGAYMYETHAGLSREYDVSCRELDFLVETVRPMPEVYGARLMGGGFGGCTINLIEQSAVEDISARVAKHYNGLFHCPLKTYVTAISQGTGIVTVGEQAKL